MTNVIEDIEIRSNGLGQSQDSIKQSIVDIDETLAPYFKKAGVVMEDEDFIYQSNIGMKYRLKIDAVDGEWGLYSANTMHGIRLHDANIEEITAHLPHILSFLEKYAETLKIMESEYAPVADTARRIADTVKECNSTDHQPESNTFAKEFWEWLLFDKTTFNRAHWLTEWLESKLKEYKQMDVHVCGCRQTIEVSTWSATKSHRLQKDIRCKKCNALLKRIDYRMDLITQFRAGEIPPKYNVILKRELGL